MRNIRVELEIINFSYPITTVISTREENHDIQTLVYKFSKNNHHSIKYLIKRREEYY